MLTAQDKQIDVRSWNALIPLNSTRSDAVSIWGEPILETEGVSSTFETDIGKVTVKYVGAKVHGMDKFDWNRPKLTILDIWVSLKQSRSITDLGYTGNKFVISTTHTGEKFFANEEAGITLISGYQDGSESLITSVSISPTKKQFDCYCISKF